MSVHISPIMPHGRKISMGNMNEEEFEKILQVLQKDFELRQKEQERLSKIQEDIEEESKKATVLSKQTKLNENVCIRCCQTFGIIFNRKQTCQSCKLFICKSCCLYDQENKGYICHICAKDKELKLKSCEWFYDNVSKKFKRFGSAKVVRTLYKQKKKDSTRKYHTDNESDGGYEPSLLTSQQYGSLQSLDRLHQKVEGSDDEGFDPVIPAPIQFGPSVIPSPNRKDINSNHNGSKEEDKYKENPKKEVADIYKEAFENARSAEEKKFHVRFDGFMSDLQKSLENLLSNGVNPNYSNNSYGDVMVTYRGKLKDLIVSLSQRLEIVIESFDSSSNDPLETSQKVRQLVSRLVTERLGESIDLGSDEAVSELSSLSEESTEPFKSYEDHLAHAVVSKVLENHRQENHLDFCLDELDGRKDEADQARNSSMSEDKSDTEKQFDNESITSDTEKCDTANNRLTSESVNQNFSLRESSDASIQCDPYIEQKHNSELERPKCINEMVQCDIQRDIGANSLDVGIDTCEPEQIEKSESVKSFSSSSSSTNVENEFEKLRSFAMDLSTSRHQPQSRELEEYLDEEPIQEEIIDRDESRQEFASRFDTFDRVHDDSRVSLPSLEDYDYEYGSGEVDPDLLSMNLAPIMEEDEEEEVEDDLDLEDDRNEEKEIEGEGQNWKGNWIFKSSSGITPYRNVGKSTKAEGLGQVYMTIPHPNQHMSPKIGQRDVDQMSDFSDDVDMENLSDEEPSAYGQTSAEHMAQKSRKQRVRSSSVQTDESDGEDVRDRSSSLSKSIHDSSADESVSSKKKKLIEEYVPADGEDPKFEIPPESIEVPEGEPAKFMLRVGGTQPINIFWYKVEDDLVELMDSEQYETSREGNHCSLTIYNPLRSDGGQYMAIAINEKGQCCQYMILTIKKNKQEFKKPEFLKDIQDIDATEGQSVKFRCKVKGYPQPRICWYKDGKLLVNDDSYKIEKFGNRDYILTIDFASMNDDAEYTVVAKNIAGETKSVAQLIVDTDEVRPTQLIRKLPTSSRKDDQQLTNLNRKMFETKTEVTHAAEDLLHAANEKTAAENVRKVTGRAMDIVESTDSLIENKMDCLATSTPRSSEESIHSPKSKKDALSENKPKWLQFVKEDGDIPMPSSSPPKNSNRTNSNTVCDDPPIKSSVSGHVPLSIDTTDHVTSELNNFTVNLTLKPEKVDNSIHMSVSDNNKNDAQHNYQSYDTHTLETSLDSSNISSDLNDYVQESEPATIINFGAKPVQSELYSRDYIINNNVAPAKPPRKKWEVKTGHFSPSAEIVNKQKDLDNVEEKIYMSASKISNLESKLQDLQQNVISTKSGDKRKISELEEEIAQTVAETYRSEHDVGAIERSVEALQVSCPASPRSVEEDNSNMSSPSLSIDSGFSSIRERPQPTIIIGSTGEDDLPESRTELNEEAGVELPSVNKLKQLFASSGDDEATFKRKCSFDGPIHSITARSLGKEKVEKIRNMARSVNHPSPLAVESTNQNAVGQSQITVTLAPITKINEPQPTQIFPKIKGEYFPQPIKSKIKTPVMEPEPMQKTVVNFKTNAAPSTQSNRNQAPATRPTPTNNDTSEVKSEQKKSRIRPGCITARAKFWEKRIQGEEPAAEEEFPSMVEQVPD